MPEVREPRDERALDISHRGQEKSIEDPIEEPTQQQYSYSSDSIDVHRVWLLHDGHENINDSEKYKIIGNIQSVALYSDMVVFPDLETKLSDSIEAYSIGLPQLSSV